MSDNEKKKDDKPHSKSTLPEESPYKPSEIKAKIFKDMDDTE